MINTSNKALGILAFVILLSGCDAAYYAVNEQFNREKRDILVDRVEDAVEAQETAKEEFKSAFEQFESVVGVPESELKTIYNELSDALEDAQDKAAKVESRVAAVEDVSQDLFDEWEDEIQQISDRGLRQKSQNKLAASKRRYAALNKAMRKAQDRMAPVLTAFTDHVLYLKHNLNAQAIASLKGELDGIESDVGRLIADMEASIAEAQSFLKDGL